MTATTSWEKERQQTRLSLVDSIVVAVPRDRRDEEGQDSSLQVVPRIADVDVEDGAVVGADACSERKTSAGGSALRRQAVTNKRWSSQQSSSSRGT